MLGYHYIKKEAYPKASSKYVVDLIIAYCTISFLAVFCDASEMK
jgi:hypothetical protein